MNPLADAQELGGGGRLGTIMTPGLHERAAEEGGFLVVGFAREHPPEERLDPGGVTAFPQEFCGDGLRRFEVGGVVLQGERLQRGIGAAGPDLARASLRGVEQEGRRDGATPERIQGPAILGRAFAGLIFEATHEELLPDAVGLVGSYGRAAEDGVEQAGAPQGSVADHPAGQTEAGPAREQAVLRILGQQGGAHGGVLPVGAAHDDELQGALEIPAMLDEVHGEPVEQLGMARALTLESEVLGGPHDSLAEQHLPEVVHGDASGQGVFGGGQPAREAEAIARGVGGPRRQGLGDVRRDLVAVLVPDAAHEHEGVARLLALGEDHDVNLAGARLDVCLVAHGPVQRGPCVTVRTMIGEELIEESFAQLDVRFGLDRRELLERRGADQGDGRPGFVGHGEAEASEVAITEGGALAEFDDEFFVGPQSQGLGEAIHGLMRLGLVRPDGGPAVARIVIEGVLHVAVVAVLLLIRGEVRDG